MSFVNFEPLTVTAAAQNLSGLGVSLADAAGAAFGPTTDVAAAAADEVSAAISQLFGNYGNEFQALNAQAAAFHREFVSLITGGAANYLGAEIANAGAVGPAAIADEILGGLGPIIIGGNSSSGGFGALQEGLRSVIGGSPLGPVFDGGGNQLGNAVSAVIAGDPSVFQRGLFAAGQTAVTSAGDPYLALFTKTNANLSSIAGDFLQRPFPALQQVAANQTRWANAIGADIALNLQDPNTLADNIATGYRGVTTFDYAGHAQTFLARQGASNQASSTALQRFNSSLQSQLPAFYEDLGGIGGSLLASDYHGAVEALPRAFLDLFLDGVEFSNLSTLTVQGPAGELLPLMSSAGQQDVVNLIPPGTYQREVVENFVAATGAGIGSLALSSVGSPIAALDGLATGLTAFSAALYAGDGVAALGAVVATPAYMLDGFLNGQTVIDLTVPLTATLEFPGIPLLDIPGHTFGVNAPITIHYPFTGILTAAQPLQVTLNVPALVTDIPVTITVPGITVSGAFRALVTDTPRAIATAISGEGAPSSPFPIPF